jgi:UDP-N-acetylmuramate dehydrogenase
MKTKLEKLSSEFSKNLKLNYDLKKKNWFNIGGKTKIYYKAENLINSFKFSAL